MSSEETTDFSLIVDRLGKSFGRKNVGNPKQHSHADRGADCYETPPEATIALTKCETLPPKIWEPACGPGAIVKVLRKQGHQVHASDIIDYGCPDSVQDDFFSLGTMPSGYHCIVTNPPFKDHIVFIEHALRLCPKVIMLGRLNWLESKRRTKILENGRLARVHVFRNRLPMMHRFGWNGKRNTSQVAYAWFVWEGHKVENTIVRRISWEKINDAVHV